jgi:ubiquinone/menaquinone biosynthesis C-methylase UbiE
MVLKPSEAKTFYDRFGKKQDTQSFYEDAATDDLIAHARLVEAEKVFEFGCGTGRFASRILSRHLQASAVYLGCDLSSTMAGLAAQRLAIYGERARVFQTDGTMHFPIQDHSVDRVISNYVLDLLSEMDIEEFFLEAHRALVSGGELCLVSLTEGTTFLSRIVTSVWNSIFHLRASLVGGCRPLRLDRYLHASHWVPEYRNVVIAFGVPSEVLVARIKGSTDYQGVLAGDAELGETDLFHGHRHRLPLEIKKQG